MIEDEMKNLPFRPEALTFGRGSITIKKMNLLDMKQTPSWTPPEGVERRVDEPIRK